jgi:hypothetical protein
MAPCMSCLLLRSPDRRSQHFCDVCKYMFRMDQAMGTIINASIMYSKCMPTVITVPLCTKFQIYLAAPCCVCPTLHSPILPIIVLLILQQSTMRAPFLKGVICMTIMIVQIARLLTMTEIVCMIPVTAMSPPPFSKLVVVPKEIQRFSSMD